MTKEGHQRLRQQQSEPHSVNPGYDYDTLQITDTFLLTNVTYKSSTFIV